MWRAIATKLARPLVPVVGLVVLAAPQVKETRQGVGRTSWLVVVDDPISFDARAAVRRGGGAITREIPAIGVYVVAGDPGLGRRLAAVPGIESVALSDEVRASDAPARQGPTKTAVGIHGRWMAGYRARSETRLAAGASLPVDDDFYFGAQWSLDAIDASEAWATGQRGAGVRVAVLDTGVDPTHPDLAANLNLALARSFVPGQTWDVSTDVVQDVDHGTHVAGIIAAADNGFGIIGVAPEAEIVPLQVLPRPSGHGPPDAVIAGIVYAADIGADVINLSVDYRYNRHGGINDLGTEDPSDDVSYTARDAALLMKAFSRATNYAHARGCTIIASGGNDAIDEDDDREEFVLPRDAPHVLGVAATGPLGWALDFATNLDVPAFYTNYGRSVIDLSAPGGNLDFDLLDSGALCTVGSGAVSATLPCWFFDGVLSTAPVKGGFLYEFRRGTSMATAHVSGVAALIIGRYGGAMHPGHVAARLRSSADDLGKRGKDDFYGRGRVNAYRAVQ
jgi:subtilisin family serine protease